MKRLCLLAASLLACASVASAHDLLIRNGKLVDGTGNPWHYADIAIDGDRVVAIGTLKDATAVTVIDAKGLVVAPGFIDVHTHVDDDILQHPLAENFIRDGVTTIVSGNCGGSVLDVGAFFKRLSASGAAVNNATLFGHNTVLRKVKGGSVAGKLTPEQMEQAKGLVDQAMRDGAVGFSTGLIYTPGTWSDTAEIIELASVAGKHGGIYATHMRSEATAIMTAIDEALQIGREAGCRVEISHFKLPTDVAETLGRGTTLKAGSDATLARVDAARAAGQEVWVDQYPYTASSTGLATLLPDRILEKGAEAARSLLRDPAERARVLEDMKQQHEVNRKRKDMSFAVIVSSPFGGGKYNGKSVMQVTQLLKLARENPGGVELTEVDKLPDVTMAEQYETVIEIYLGGGGSGVFHSMDEVEVSNILRHPLVGVASDSGIRVFNQGVPHPRGYGTNTRILGRYVRELHVVTLEDAVRKMTSLPATAFRFEDRGTLREGAFADIVIFDAATVADQATFEKPHQYPIGIRCVIVNGKVAFDGEKMTGAKPGAILLGPGAVTQ